MIRKSRFAWALVGMMALPVGVAQAQDFKPYFGLGLGVYGLEDKEPGFSQKSNVFGGFIKGGVNFNDYVGAELRVGTTMKGTKSYAAGVLGTAAPSTVDLKGDYLVSYLIRLQYPVASNFAIYALGGGTTAKFKRSVNSAGVSTVTKATKIGATYGAGLDYDLGDGSTIGAEWVQYWTNVKIAPNSKAKIWGATANWTMYF